MALYCFVTVIVGFLLRSVCCVQTYVLSLSMLFLNKCLFCHVHNKLCGTFSRHYLLLTILFRLLVKLGTAPRSCGVCGMQEFQNYDWGERKYILSMLRY